MQRFNPLTHVHLTGLARDLAARADTGKPIRVGVIGSGEMGTDLVTQGALMRGIEVAAIATRRPHTAREAMVIAFGDEDRAVEADTTGKVSAAIEAGKIAITSAMSAGLSWPSTMILHSDVSRMPLFFSGSAALSVW